MSFIKPFGLLICYILFCPLVYAQQQYTTPPNKISWSPIRMVDPVNPGIELGYERRHNKRWASQVSLGYMTPLFKTLYVYDEYKGKRFSFEEKYFVSNRRHHWRDSYFSAEFVFLGSKYNSTGSFKNDTSQLSLPYIDTFRVHKQTYSLNIRSGFQAQWKRFLLDVSVGVGLKYKQVRWEGHTQTAPVYVYPRHPNARTISDKRGNYFDGNLPFNCRILYGF